jgi:ADP-ribosylation factor GTPase-activating protein 2/3
VLRSALGLAKKLTQTTEWQWEQLRIMKVGGNESATKYFQSNGGTAALNSKDPKTKYQSNAATKYKEELKRRAAKDAAEYVLFGIQLH